MQYYSQWGQDKYLNENIFKGKRNGIFVDIGAHDGITGSNSYFFEKELDWTGLCVEPILNRYVELVKNRNCLCLNFCVYKHKGIIDFTEIEGYSEMLSGISSTHDNRHLQRLEIEQKIHGGNTKNIKKHCFPLQDLLNLADIKNIDYLSIDTEGSEYDIILGIDFEKTNINVIDVENNYPDSFSKIDDLLKKYNYEKIITIGGDEIYKKNNYIINGKI